MAVSWSTNVEKAINFVKQALVILLRGRIQLKSKQCFSMIFVLYKFVLFVIRFAFHDIFGHIALKKGWS